MAKWFWVGLIRIEANPSARLCYDRIVVKQEIKGFQSFLRSHHLIMTRVVTFDTSNTVDTPKSLDQLDQRDQLVQPDLTLKRRRSSIKAASLLPPRTASTYQHPDPLLRRLRLRRPQGQSTQQTPVNLARQFTSSVKIVCFLFG